MRTWAVGLGFVVLLFAGASLAFRTGEPPRRGPGDLAILYAGDPESPRTERFRDFLSASGARVETIALTDLLDLLDEAAAEPFDVVVADWHRRYVEKGYDAGTQHAMQLPRGFAKPVVMVGAVAGELVRPWSKINWL